MVPDAYGFVQTVQQDGLEDDHAAKQGFDGIDVPEDLHKG